MCAFQPYVSVCVLDLVRECLGSGSHGADDVRDGYKIGDTLFEDGQKLSPREKPSYHTAIQRERTGVFCQLRVSLFVNVSSTPACSKYLFQHHYVDDRDTRPAGGDVAHRSHASCIRDTTRSAANWSIADA